MDKTWKQTKRPLTDGWMNTVHTYTAECVDVCVIHTHIQWSLLSLRKEWNDVIFSYTDGPRDYHTTWSHRKGKYKYRYDITYMRNLNYDRNELIYKPETDAQTSRPDLRLQRQRGGGGGSTGVSGISRCKLFYVEWINDKVLLYGIGTIFNII